MNIHSIILARGGSKSIKNKNLILLKKKPLLYWSINRSKLSKLISHTWVSSDSKKILNVAEKYGAKIIKRPKIYAKDGSTSESAWIHAIKYIKKYHNIDLVVGIQPTSPIRKNSDFDNGIKLFVKKKFDSMFSSNKIHDFNTWKYKNKKLVSNYNYKKRKRRQDIHNFYLENGSYYIFKPNTFLKEKNRLFGKIGQYEMEKESSFQVDDLIDLKIIRLLI